MAADTAKGNTPIADAWAFGRPVMPDAMVLIRKLERDRAELLERALRVWWEGEENAELRHKYPLDKIELP